MPIKSTRPICTRSSCVRNARNVASALRPLPKRSRKPVLFVTEPLQSLGNGQANERKSRRNRSEQRKIDLPSQNLPPPRSYGVTSRHGRQSVIRGTPNATRETRALLSSIPKCRRPIRLRSRLRSTSAWRAGQDFPRGRSYRRTERLSADFADLNGSNNICDIRVIITVIFSWFPSSF